MHTSVREIHFSLQSDFSYFLRVDSEGRSLGLGFQLVLTDGQKAWRGKVSEAMVNDEAEELEMPKEKYIHDLQQALTEFKLGSVLLEAVKEPAEVVREVLTHTLQQGNALQRHNHKLREENQRLIQEHKRITEEVKRYAEGKEALEAELYSRFVLVLNEKKTKIRSLQEAVTNLQETSCRTSDGLKNKDSVKSDRTAGQNRKEDEYGGSTDEELTEEESTAASHLPSRDSATPSPLNLRDITDVAPCRKRRFRHLGAPELTVKKLNPEVVQKKRTDSCAASSQLQIPQPSPDASKATSAAEDLFDDF
ncbi:DNA repair protein XRCC4 isoform X2 [Fundulus heteroclitus]|uniref:DNA repair protein XRCC4 isoform X2 n=1 Tax=Fundulus heteroclitus TaxID=8078 RepID=UPI00165A23F6|nr:DNA repair protein XRCC4 isoform X2 [Fundulus heteroclitus]